MAVGVCKAMVLINFKEYIFILCICSLGKNDENWSGKVSGFLFIGACQMCIPLGEKKKKSSVG